MRPDEVRHVIEDSSAHLVLRTAAEIDGAEPLLTACKAEPDDVAALFYTSGTTGKPKGVELSHRSLVGQVAAAGSMPTSLLIRGGAVLSLPIAHIMGFAATLGSRARASPSTSSRSSVRTMCSTRSNSGAPRSSSVCLRCTA